MVIVSIVVPCYMQASFLEECLDSVLAQTYSDWECIIVNDGSPDETEKIVSNYSTKDSRFKYIEKENGGLSSARNTGIEKAKGTYILPLDADDKISPNYVETCVKTIQTDNNIKIVYGSAEKFGAINQVWSLAPYSFEKLKINNLIFCTALYRKIDWEASSGYDTNMKGGLEDWEFWLNLMQRGGHAVKEDSITFYYRVKDSSMITNLNANAVQIAQLSNYIFVKHNHLYEHSSAIQLYKETQKLYMLEKHLTVGDLLSLFFKKIMNRFSSSAK